MTTMISLVQLVFPVKGTKLHADHNYRLLGSLCRKIPELHNLQGLAINTISGIPDQQGSISLTSSSRFFLRIPVDAISLVYPLVGQTLTVGEYQISLGNPKLETIQGCESLKSRLVTIKGYTEPMSFLQAANRQLESLEIHANLGILANHQGEPKRLTLKINKPIPKRSYTIVGFTVVVSDLTEEDSIKLQVSGLGGKRRLGCGVFYPNVPNKKTYYQTKYDATQLIS